MKPRIVCLCGSARFLAEFDRVSLTETLAGRIVLSLGSHRIPDAEWLAPLPSGKREAALARLGVLHFAKIDLSDEVLVVNVGGYIGESTRQEIAYAQAIGKPVRYLVPRSEL